MGILDQTPNTEHLFIGLYRDFMQAYRKDPKDRVDLDRLKRLEVQVNRQWETFSLNKQKELIRALVAEDLAPQSWLDLAEMFDCQTILIK